jgi:hypothetical protein
MESVPRILIASQPGAWRLLEGMLKDVVELVPAHTTTDAFDESRMIEFLQSVLKNTLIASMRDACIQCSAVDLTDVAKLPEDKAREVRAAVRHSLESGATKN